MDDPRRILQTAADQRARIELLPRQGRWRVGQVVRVERGGVVVLVGGGAPPTGTDVRCFLTLDRDPWTFEASVLRVGIPVPDRSQDGVLLGFLDGFRRADREHGGLVLEVVPANGRPVSLVDGAVRIVELAPSEWTVTAPTSFTLVFVEKGTVRLRLALPGQAPMEVVARIHQLARGEGHLLYSLHIEDCEDPDRYRDIVAGLRATLGV